MGCTLAMLIFNGIIRKNGSTSKAKELRILKIILNPLVRLTKLAPMTLVKNENNPFTLDRLQPILVALLADSRIQFLNGGNDKFGIIFKLANQNIRAFGTIYTPLAETIKLLGSLVIQIPAIHHEYYLLNLRHIHDNLTRLKGGKRLTRTRSMPDIPILCRVFNPIYQSLHRIILIRP